MADRFHARTRFATRWAALATVAALLAGCAGMADPSLSEDAARLLRVAVSTRDAGDPATAIKLLRQVHAMDPENVETLIALATTLGRLGSYDEAVVAWRDAFAADPQNTSVLEGLGRAYIGMGDARQAAHYFEVALKAGAGARSHNGLGLAYDLLGQPEPAQASYRKGLALKPGDDGIANNLALSLALSGAYPEAIELLTNLVERFPGDVRYRLNLALALGLAGETELAAQIARSHLDEASVQRNLAFYGLLREFDDHAAKVRAVGVLNRAVISPGGNAIASYE